ncbi:hypothetical protein DVK85_12990 [Flavobacterium arcticum]|uniref:Outer membrane protein assembly factor n=1 Tax=Flavobacterium arcticum TaxID=1784713 RepID=A0A345HET5_9FLAO|nr:hypothetical protein [Flavobacterium arcticum]AXG75095.1 hypothetical protein DVK85_12990 [Flavobacterium arcticum]KAF2511126.1 hypothetical protein E0W72_06955 [Flavobacterium arcticum]
MHVRIKLLLLLLFFGIGLAAAQDKPKKNDTIKGKQQQEVYKEIENYSKKSKFTKVLHKLIFKSVSSNHRKQSKNYITEIEDLYKKYEGRVIRNIQIETLDPFGYSVSDTTRKPRKWIERSGNSVHIKTKEFTIRNRLLFKKNERLDSLLVKESERLIRSQRYARRVIIKPVPIPSSKDSVDVYVRVLDSWSLTPNISASGSGTNIEVTERNFLGWGHQFANNIDKNINTGETSYLARYKISNIKNTFIDAELNYQTLETENSLKSLGLQRVFFSPITRWAGGVYFEERLVRDSLPNAQYEWERQNQKSQVQDYWTGHSFKIFKRDNEEYRTTNLVTTGRFFNKTYNESPSVAYDSIGYYTKERLYLASIGITSRKFVQDRYLFNYDIVEDVPVGRVYSSTFGVQDKNKEHRFYFGGRYAFGDYFKWGFLSINAQVGAFFYKGKTEETVLRFDMLYFSNIKNWGNWRFRHFIKPTLVFGDNRQPIITDLLNINEENGIHGFNNRTIVGTKKALLTLQTQSYSPWNISGFRLNPFASFTMGVIGNKTRTLFESKVYSKIGVGLLIYNDYLVFNSIQLSLAFYPTIPGEGDNIFKTNTFKNTDISLPNFRIGKPVVAPYE